MQQCSRTTVIMLLLHIVVRGVILVGALPVVASLVFDVSLKAWLLAGVAIFVLHLIGLYFGLRFLYWFGRKSAYALQEYRQRVQARGEREG